MAHRKLLFTLALFMLIPFGMIFADTCEMSVGTPNSKAGICENIYGYGYDVCKFAYLDNDRCSSCPAGCKKTSFATQACVKEDNVDWIAVRRNCDVFDNNPVACQARSESCSWVPESCIPAGSAVGCLIDTDCCEPQKCDEYNYMCVLPKAEAATIAGDPDPPTPNGLIVCTSNCPPANLHPSIIVKYKWQREAIPAEYTTTYEDYDCVAGFCFRTEKIALWTKYCSASNPDICGEAGISNQLVIGVEAIPMPQSALIQPETGTMLTPNGKAICAQNCPPPNVPQSTQQRTEYQWNKNGLVAQDWDPALQAFDCAMQNCKEGDIITLKTRTCRLPGPSCSTPSTSNQLAVAIQLPPQPPAPEIAAELSPLATNGIVGCIGNCPPGNDEVPGGWQDRFIMQYRWSTVDSSGGVTEKSWMASPGNYDCLSESCEIGTTVYLHNRFCLIENPSLCGAHETSNGVSVEIEGGLPSQWQTGLDLTYALIAIAIAISLLALAYMASYVFNLPHIRPIILDEIIQVMATGAILLGIVGTNLVIDEYSKAVLETTGDTAHATMMEAAGVTLISLETRSSTIFDNLAKVSATLGREASKGIFCNFLGTGFSLVNCSPFNAFRGSLTFSSFAVSTALANTYAQQFILALARNTAFSFIIPLGLFLRCFKASRKAGGALIAIGFGFYTVFPLMIVTTENMLHENNPDSPVLVPEPPECDPGEPDVTVSRGDFLAYAFEFSDFERAENLAYIAVVRVIFLSILNLIVTLGFIRAFAHVIGSEIDVSSLARIS